MARCRCGSDRCMCVVMAGPGITVAGNGSTRDPYIVSGDGTATVTTGCGLAGDGSANAPLVAATAQWPYPCNPDEVAGGVYCDSSGVLRSEPRPHATHVQSQVNQMYPDLAVPSGTDVLVETRTLVIPNSDLCREAFVILEIELDVDFDLPPGATATAGLGTDDMQHFVNTGTTTAYDLHTQVTKIGRRSIPPGGTLTEQVQVTMGRGTRGATYNRIQTYLRAFIFVL